jgi:hypothetical protein
MVVGFTTTRAFVPKPNGKLKERYKFDSSNTYVLD